MDIGDQIRNYWVKQLQSTRNPDMPNWIINKKEFHGKNGRKIPRITGKGTVYHRFEDENNEIKVNYRLSVTFFIKDGDMFYHEEEERLHQAVFYKDTLVEDTELDERVDDVSVPTVHPMEREDVRMPKFDYDRRAAVQYAERWWNDYNSEYKAFDVDCTNYVSQCLYAGGAPMRGAPKKENGWWYQGESWSYSWAVAHSLRWYLSGSNQGLKGKEIEDPRNLKPGDVICYDFEGDDRWDHTAIVVDKDKSGMPLVNAHSNNSRHRYWSYEDSLAWTPDIKYKFFQIGD